MKLPPSFGFVSLIQFSYLIHMQCDSIRRARRFRMRFILDSYKREIPLNLFWFAQQYCYKATAPSESTWAGLKVFVTGLLNVICHLSHISMFYFLKVRLAFFFFNPSFTFHFSQSRISEIERHYHPWPSGIIKVKQIFDHWIGTLDFSPENVPFVRINKSQ